MTEPGCHDRYHYDRHGLAWDGSSCPACGERFTRPRETLAYRLRLAWWKVRHPRLVLAMRHWDNED